MCTQAKDASLDGTLFHLTVLIKASQVLRFLTASVFRRLILFVATEFFWDPSATLSVHSTEIHEKRLLKKSVSTLNFNKLHEKCSFYNPQTKQRFCGRVHNSQAWVWCLKSVSHSPFCDTCHCVSAESALTCRGILGTPKKPEQTVWAALCLLLWSPFDAVEEDPLYITNPSG